MRKLLRGVVALLVLVTAWSFGGPATASDAATAKCSIIQSAVVGGLDFTRLGAERVCDGYAYSNGAVSGVSTMTANRVTVRYDEANSPTLQIQRTTIHELTHLVEYRTSDTYRIKLYALLGVSTSGNYYDIPTVSGANLDEWKANPRERLAESSALCAFGSNSFSGMALVPTSQCPLYLATLRAAIAATPAT